MHTDLEWLVMITSRISMKFLSSGAVPKDGGPESASNSGDENPCTFLILPISSDLLKGSLLHCGSRLNR